MDAFCASANARPAGAARGSPSSSAASPTRGRPSTSHGLGVRRRCDAPAVRSARTCRCPPDCATPRASRQHGLAIFRPHAAGGSRVADEAYLDVTENAWDEPLAVNVPGAVRRDPCSAALPPLPVSRHQDPGRSPRAEEARRADLLRAESVDAFLHGSGCAGGWAPPRLDCGAPLDARRRRRRKHADDVAVEADSGGIEERAAVQLTGVDHAVTSGERRLECRLVARGNPDFPAEAVAGTDGHDAERRRAAHQRRRHLVDRPVAAPRHDEVGSRLQRLLRERMRVPGAVGQSHLPLGMVPAEQRLDPGGERARAPPPPRRPRGWIGDHHDVRTVHGLR